jgi:hypothetical protein
MEQLGHLANWPIANIAANGQKAIQVIAAEFSFDRLLHGVLGQFEVLKNFICT